MRTHLKFYCHTCQAQIIPRSVSPWRHLLLLSTGLIWILTVNHYDKNVIQNLGKNDEMLYSCVCPKWIGFI